MMFVEFFFVILYEKLPTFCYICGMVGHGSKTSHRRPAHARSESSLSPKSGQGAQNGTEDRNASVA